MGDFLRVIGRGLDIFIFAYMIYFMFFVLMGLRTRMQKKGKEPEKRFAVIVPAHNEEDVILPLLKNLKKLDYPRRLYDIVVIADNCQDSTARRANVDGVKVIERFNGRNKGKGYALRYAFHKLGFLNETCGYDAAVVFDADNLVAPNFLRVMNSRLLAGEKLIQAYIDSKNPDDSWVTATFSMMFWVNNRFNLLAHYNINLSSVLMGTGMCISRDVLAEVGFHTESLTEDLEFSIQALSRGIKTSFACETRIYDEKPLSLKDSIRQRLRWARGQLNVAIHYIPHLFCQAFRKRSFAIFEGGLRLFQLFFIMSSLGSFVLRMLSPEVARMTPLLSLTLAFIGPLEYIMPVFPYLLPTLVLILDRLPLRPFRYLLFFPLFLYSWAPILYWAFFTLRKGDWMPTEHSRRVSMAELAEKSGPWI